MTIVFYSYTYCNYFSVQSYINKLPRIASKPDGELIVIFLFVQEDQRQNLVLISRRGDQEPKTLRIEFHDLFFFQQQR